MQRVSVDLNTATFPVQYEAHGQTCMINRGFDGIRYPGPPRGQNFTENLQYPQAYYLQNVMPSAKGFTSFHFKEVLEAPPEFDGAYTEGYELQDTLGNFTLFLPAQGKNFFYSSRTNEWNSFPINLGANPSSEVTVVSNKSNVFICYSGVGLFVYNFISSELEKVFPWGIEMDEIIGVSAGNNYLILTSANRTYWTPAGLEFVSGLQEQRDAYRCRLITDNAENIAATLADLPGTGLDFYPRRAGNNCFQIQAHFNFLAQFLSDPPELADINLGSGPFYQRWTSEVTAVSGSYYANAGPFETQEQAFAAASQDYFALKNALDAADAQTAAIFPDVDEEEYTYFIDFRPDLIVGAGSSQITSVKGRIIAVHPLADGFIVYTTVNAVGANYSGQPAIPFTFREIPGSSGIARPEHVAASISQDFHIAYTYSGFQRVSFREADPFWVDLAQVLLNGIYSENDPEAFSFQALLEGRDFLPHKYTFENLNKTYSFSSLLMEAEFEPIFSKAVDQLQLRLSALISRYIIVSVQPLATDEEIFQQAYVYDLTLDRWGKLQLPHNQIFQFNITNFNSEASFLYLLAQDDSYEDYLEGNPPFTTFTQLLRLGKHEAQPSFGVVSPEGRILSGSRQVTLEDEPVNSRLILGKFKLIREAGVRIQDFNVKPFLEGAAWLILHDEASNESRKVKLDIQEHELYGLFYTYETGESISLDVRGSFNLASISLTMDIMGRKSFTSAGG